MNYADFEPLMRRRGSVLSFHLSPRGFIYSIICHNGICKIGASTNPVARIRDQITRGGDLNCNGWPHRRARVTDVFISKEIENFRRIERIVQSAFGSFRVGLNVRAETFKLPPDQRVELVHLFESNFCEILIAADVKSGQLQEAAA